MSTFLGLDVGTTTITAMILDVKEGSVAGIHTVANSSDVTRPSDRALGRSEWDATRIVELAGEAVSGAVSRFGSVDGIGVTGQMHGMLLVDGGNNPVGPFVGWQDRRGMEMIHGRDVSYVDHLVRVTREHKIQGCRPHSGYLGTTLYWMAVQELLPRHPVTATFLPDFVVARLTGTSPVTDATNAAGSGLFDQGDWALDLVQSLELSSDILPEIVPSGSHAGGLTREVADAVGLREGLPICVACGDNQASFAGSVSDYESSVLINVGTGGQISAYTEKATSMGELEARPFMDGGFLLVGPGLVGGRTYALLRDFFRFVGESFFVENGDGDLYSEMNRLASRVPPGSDGLICQPLFTGTRSDPTRRGEFTGVSATNFTPGHLVRAVMEGMSEQFHLLYVDMSKQAVLGRERLIGAGNGIRKNEVLRQILSSRFEMPMYVPKHTEEAAYGACLMAAVNGEMYEDVKQAGRAIRFSE